MLIVILLILINAVNILLFVDQREIFFFRFSSAKRCSNEGRALMQLDYRSFVVKLDKISERETGKPVPYQVEDFFAHSTPVIVVS